MKKFSRFLGALSFALLFLTLVFGQVPGTKDNVPQPKEKQGKGGQKETDGKDKKKPFWQVVWEGSKSERVSGRQNGVRLRAEVDIRKDKKGDVVLVHWLLDYNGPRQPLVILKPTLDVAGFKQCMVTFHLVDDEGFPHDVYVSHDAEGADEFALQLLEIQSLNPKKEQMLFIEKGKIGKVTMEIPLAQIESLVRKKLPGQFAKFPPERMLAQLRFDPSSRAPNLNLDPWTGMLQSEWVPVPLGKFAKN